MLHKKMNHRVGAYPTHQAIQTMGSTAPITFESQMLLSKFKSDSSKE
jgi:hypothetical protein